MNTRPRSWARARGVSLIEVLVSLVVVSLGALSATSLQMVSKRNNWEATQRLQATHLANTLIQRMRANSSTAALQTYAALGQRTDTLLRPIGGHTLHEQFDLDCVERPAECCSGELYVCTSENVAAIELWQLEQLMDGELEKVDGAGVSGLDSPTACIDAPVPSGSEGFYKVTIAFRGTLAIPADLAEPCGLDATDGSAKLYGASNEYRRTLTISAYIAPTVAK